MNISFLYATALSLFCKIFCRRHIAQRISAKCVSHTVKPSRKYALRQVNRIITVISYSYEKGTHKPPTYME